MKTSLVVVAACIALGGCASDKSATTPTTTSAPQCPPAGGMQGGGMRGGGMQGGGMMQGGMRGMGPMSPMRVPGTTVTATDTEGGVALDFETSGDAAEVQARVQHMASRGMMPMMTPGATASAENTAHGARVVFRPTDPAHLGALRELVHARAKWMALQHETPQP